MVSLMRSFKNRLRAGVIVGSIAVTGCGWWNNGGGAQVAQNSGMNVLSCVLEAAMTGNLTLTGLATACVGASIGDILSAVDSLLVYYASPLTDAGSDGAQTATAQSVYCGDATKKPYEWAPTCVDVGVIANLRAAKSNVLAARAGAK